VRGRGGDGGGGTPIRPMLEVLPMGGLGLVVQQPGRRVAQLVQQGGSQALVAVHHLAA